MARSRIFRWVKRRRSDTWGWCEKDGSWFLQVKCLAIMDEVHAKCEAVIITKHGKPVTKLVPVNAEKDEMYDFLAGKGVVVGDIIAPALTSGRVTCTQVILVDTHVVAWLALDQHRSRGGRERHRWRARECGGLANLGYYPVEIGHNPKQGPEQPQHQPRIVPAGSGVSVRRLANQRPGLCVRYGTSGDISQGSRRSHYRCCSAGSGTIFTYRGP